MSLSDRVWKSIEWFGTHTIIVVMVLLIVGYIVLLATLRHGDKDFKQWSKEPASEFTKGEVLAIVFLAAMFSRK